MRLLLLILLIPAVGLAQERYNYGPNLACAKTVDECWDREIPFRCIDNYQQNLEYMGEIIGGQCNAVLRDREIYNENLGKAAEQVFKYYIQTRRLRRRLFLAKKECKR